MTNGQHAHSQEVVIAIDAMGGDHGPHVTVPAAVRILNENPNLNIILVGLQDAIEAELKVLRMAAGPRLRVHHASEVVLMDESPQSAMKNKKDSSMRVAINMVKTGEAQACVSAGNTGALMATARSVSYTHLDVYKRQVENVSVARDNADKISINISLGHGTSMSPRLQQAH